MNMESSWKGTPISELSRKELIEVVEWLGVEMLRLRKDRDRWFAAGDPLEYMKQGDKHEFR